MLAPCTVLASHVVAYSEFVPLQDADKAVTVMYGTAMHMTSGVKNNLPTDMSPDAPCEEGTV